MEDEQPVDYELVVIVRTEAEEEGYEATIESISNYISSHGGSVTDVERWGKRRLAYPIKRYGEGNYVLTLTATGSGIQDQDIFW